MKKLLYVLVLFAGIANAQIVNIPDANFKAKLVQASATNGYAINFAGNFMVIDTNGDGQIQNTEALQVKILAMNGFSISNLTGIEAFTNLEELSCIQNQLTSLNVSALTNLKLLRCSNNSISILNISGLTQLETLEFNMNLVTAIDLSSLVNLKSLNCYHNLMTSLNASQNTLLQSLWCSDGILNSLNVQGLINLTTLFINSNQLTSVNLSSLTNLIQLQCQNNQLTSLDISSLTNLTSLICGQNQITVLDISHQNLYELGCSENLLTTLDLSSSPDLGQLFFGNPGLAPVDLSGFTNLNHMYFYGGNQTTINISNSPLLVDVGFINTSLTSIDISSNPSIFNFYLNSNSNLNYINLKNGGNVSSGVLYCPNLQYVCANESDIANFTNAVATGANNNPNTVVNSYCSFTPGGDYNTITGTLTFDANNNGCDLNDILQPNIRIGINDSTNTGASFTNLTGNYTFYTQAGSFTITPQVENPTWFNFSPSSSAVVPFSDTNNNTNTQNFCITANGIHPDVEVVIAPITPARPGFDAVYQLVYKNKGNQTLSGNLSFTYNDLMLDFISSDFIPTSQSTGLLSYDYTNLRPFENRSFYITLHVNAPTDTPAVNIGDQLNFTATVNPITGDENQSDNTFQFKQTVVGSFDPNDVTCIEGNMVSPSEIGNYLHYVINFENTGTADAENIVVRDVIDANQFDLNSLQLLNSSAPVTARLTGNVAEFIFQNINLHSGGHGNILIKVKSKSTLVQGDSVSKKASIYFDYNAPVDTNLENTIFQALSNPDNPLDVSISVYPNPTKGNVNINCNNNIQLVQLFDVQGRLLKTELVNQSNTVIDISGKANGVYFLKVKSDKGIVVQKIVKE